MMDLGTLDPKANGGLGQSWGLAINSSGVVVGQSNPTGATSEYQTDAVVWQPGTNGSYALSDLNSLIPSGTGWTLWRADAINGNGQIVVEATNSSLSGWYALLLTPSTTTTALASSATSAQTAALPNSTSPLTAASVETAPSLLVSSPQAPSLRTPEASNAPSPSMTDGDSSPRVASTQPSSVAATMPAPRQANLVDVLGQLFAELDAGLSLDG
jgi:hypothetical protein